LNGSTHETARFSGPLLKGYSRKSKVFICCPFETMKEMSRAIKKLGFSLTKVYKEEFKL